MNDRADAANAAKSSQSIHEAAASLPRSDGTFSVRKLRRSSSKKNRSVKVPPTSTPARVRRSHQAVPPQTGGGGLIDAAIGAERDAIVTPRMFDRHIAEANVARDQRRVAL